MARRCGMRCSCWERPLQSASAARMDEVDVNSQGVLSAEPGSRDGCGRCECVDGEEPYREGAERLAPFRRQAVIRISRVAAQPFADGLSRGQARCRSIHICHWKSRTAPQYAGL